EDKCCGLHCNIVAAVTPLLAFNTEHPFEPNHLGKTTGHQGASAAQLSSVSHKAQDADVGPHQKQHTTGDCYVGQERPPRPGNSVGSRTSAPTDETNGREHSYSVFERLCSVEGHRSPTTRVGVESCSAACPYGYTSNDFLIQAAAAEVLGCAALLPSGRQAIKDAGAIPRLGERLLVSQSESVKDNIAAVRISPAEAERNTTNPGKESSSNCFCLRPDTPESRIIAVPNRSLTQGQAVSRLGYASLSRWCVSLRQAACLSCEVKSSAGAEQSVSLRCLPGPSKMYKCSHGHSLQALPVIPPLALGKSFEHPEGRLLLKLLRACGDLGELKAGIVNKLLTEPDLLHSLYGSFAIVEVTKTLQSELLEEQRQATEAKLSRKSKFLELLNQIELERKILEGQVLAIREWGICTEEELLRRNNSGRSCLSMAGRDAAGFAESESEAQNANTTPASGKRGTRFDTTVKGKGHDTKQMDRSSQEGAQHRQSLQTVSSPTELPAGNVETGDVAESMTELDQLYLMEALKATNEKRGTCCCRHCLKDDARDRKFLTMASCLQYLLQKETVDTDAAHMAAQKTPTRWAWNNSPLIVGKAARQRGLQLLSYAGRTRRHSPTNTQKSGR
ncbi:hypothetical protein CSUI_003336, partial [Cystoisospora suis]